MRIGIVEFEVAVKLWIQGLLQLLLLFLLLLLLLAWPTFPNSQNVLFCILFLFSCSSSKHAMNIYCEIENSEWFTVCIFS